MTNGESRQLPVAAREESRPFGSAFRESFLGRAISDSDSQTRAALFLGASSRVKEPLRKLVTSSGGSALKYGPLGFGLLLTTIKARRLVGRESLDKASGIRSAFDGFVVAAKSADVDLKLEPKEEITRNNSVDILGHWLAKAEKGEDLDSSEIESLLVLVVFAQKQGWFNKDYKPNVSDGVLENARQKAEQLSKLLTPADADDTMTEDAFKEFLPEFFRLTESDFIRALDNFGGRGELAEQLAAQRGLVPPGMWSASDEAPSPAALTDDGGAASNRRAADPPQSEEDPEAVEAELSAERLEKIKLELINLNTAISKAMDRAGQGFDDYEKALKEKHKESLSGTPNTTFLDFCRNNTDLNPTSKLQLKNSVASVEALLSILESVNPPHFREVDPENLEKRYKKIRKHWPKTLLGRIEWDKVVESESCNNKDVIDAVEAILFSLFFVKLIDELEEGEES